MPTPETEATEVRAPAQNGGVGCELFGEPLADPVAAPGGAAREALQALGPALHEQIAFRHRLVGGASPVAMCQIFEAVRLAAIVAPAPRPA